MTAAMSRKKNQNMSFGKKGQLEIPIIAVGAIIAVVVIVVFSIFLKVHIVRTVEVEYKYSNAELSLLALLSDRAAYEKISMYAAGLPAKTGKFDQTSAVNYLRTMLDKIVQSKCYKLSYGGTAIIDKTGQSIDGKTCKPEFKATAVIALPGVQATAIELMMW